MHMLYLGSRRGRGFGEEELSRIGNLVVEEFGSFTMFPAAGFGYSACSVEVEGCMSLSLLQGRLNELGTGFQIELRDL